MSASYGIAILRWFGLGTTPPPPVVTQKIPETVPWSSYDNACRSLGHEMAWRRRREDEIRRLNARIHLQRQEIRMLHEKIRALSGEGTQPVTRS